MADFFRQFTTKKGLFELRFSKVENLTTPKYFIAVKSGDYQVAFFEMKRIKGVWKVVEPAPECIYKAEETLSRIILEQCESIAVE